MKIDEKAGGIALMVVGITGFLTMLNSLGFELESALMGYLIPIPIFLLGVYAYLRKPYNNGALVLGSALAFYNLIGIVFGFGVGPSNFDPTFPQWIFNGAYLVATLVGVLAATADVVEEYLP